ncbi:MAG: hypothetical protein ACE5OZ_21525 [Candidatus Heimdallarchaeota archaeon]
MSEEFVKELFEGLKQTNTAFELGQALSGLRTTDSAQAQRLAGDVLQLLKKYSNELAGRSEDKKAGFQFFTGAEVLREFFPEKTEERSHWLLSSAAHLEKASQTYRDFDDIDGAAACMVIAALLRINTGEFTVGDTVDSFVESLSDSDYAGGRNASGIVYIPYDLIEGLEEDPPNPSRIHRAEQYIESYLLQVQLSSLFTQAIRDAVGLVRKELTNRIKLPKLTCELTHSRDLVFGEPFECRILFENKGEGPAQNVNYSLQLDSDLEVIEGETNVTVGSIEVAEKSEFAVKLTCATGEGETQVEKNLAINITYEDVLQNKRSTAADYQMEFLTYRRSDEFKKQIDKAQSSLEPVLARLSGISEEKASITLIESLSMLSKRHLDNATQLIEEEEFERVETLIQTVNEMVRDLEAPIKEFVSQIHEMKQMMLNYSGPIKKALQNASEGLRRVKTKAEEVNARG